MRWAALRHTSTAQTLAMYTAAAGKISHRLCHQDRLPALGESAEEGERASVVERLAFLLGDRGERQERAAVDVVGEEHQQERQPGGVEGCGGTDRHADHGGAVDDEVRADVEEPALAGALR